MSLAHRGWMAAGAGLLSARTAARLRRPKAWRGEQAAAFGRLASRFAQAQFWAGQGIEPGLGYSEFRRRIPPRAYEDFVPSIERMKRGASGVLWPGECGLYAISSGTTAGRTKYLPVTPAMLAHFRRAGLDSLLYYAARTRGNSVFRGRHLFLGGSTALARIPEAGPFPALAGDLSGIAALNLPLWVERLLYEPGRDIAQMTDWPAKIAAITRRTRGRDIALLAGIPTWTLVLAEALLKEGRAANLGELWPHLECFVHGGVPVGPFEEELRAALGPNVGFHEVYPASEAFIAAQDAEAEAGLRLMTGTGVFFEFISRADFDAARMADMGAYAMPMADVAAGVDYVLLLTTPAGLGRYVIGDVVRFISVDPPRLVYVGRTQLQLSAFGEHVIEKELTDALLAVCRRHGCSTADFHVAPLFPDGPTPGRHEWWIELKAATAEALSDEILAEELDAELQRRNDDYEAKRKGGGMAAPVVRRVPPGGFERWLRDRGKWGGQHKTPRCRSDRKVAEELSSTVEPAPA